MNRETFRDRVRQRLQDDEICRRNAMDFHAKYGYWPESWHRKPKAKKKYREEKEEGNES